MILFTIALKNNGTWEQIKRNVSPVYDETLMREILKGLTKWSY